MNASDIEVEELDWKVRRCFVFFWKNMRNECGNKKRHMSSQRCFFLEGRGSKMDMVLSK